MRTYEDEGHGPAVLLLHAGIADRRMWLEHIAWLADAGFWAIAPDLPGFGEHPLQPDSPPVWEAVLSLLDHLDIESAIVVGCSFGGAVALRMAVCAPERINALALISAPAPGLQPSPQLVDAWNAEEAAMDIGDIDRAVGAVVDGWLAPDAPDNLRHLVGTMQRRALELQTSVALQERPDPIDEDPSLLGTITAPTLVAVGQRDMPDFRWSARQLAGSIPLATHHVIRGAGHLAPLENPAAFQALLGQFLLSLR